MFIFAGSLSGALAAPAWTEDDLKALKAIQDSVFNVFGPVMSDTRKANDIYEITRGLSLNDTVAISSLNGKTIGDGTQVKY